MDSTLSARRALGARRESVVNKAEGIWTHQQPEGFTEWFLARATPPGLVAVPLEHTAPSPNSKP